MKRFIKNIAGATAIEYALIASLVAIGAIVGMQSLGSGSTGSINSTFAKASGKLL